VTSGTVSTGAASVTYVLPAGTATGPYTIVATYNPSTNFTGSSDDTKTLTVGARATTTVAANALSTYSEQAVNVTLSATVSAASSTVNAGTVTFQVKNGATNVGSAVTSGTVSTGAASVTYVLPAGTATGPYTIVATYNPSTNFTGSSGSATLTITPRQGRVAYIGQTVFVASGTSSTTVQATLSASVSDVDGLGSTPIVGATVTFTDLLSNQVLASGVKVSPVVGSPGTGTANTVVTLSTGQYGFQQYLIEVKLVPGNFVNDQQLTAPHDSAAYLAAHPTLVAMIPTQLNSMQGAAGIDKLSTAAGTYGNATGASYGVGLKYNNKGTNPQGQIQLILERSDGTYFIKSNSITSVAFSNPDPVSHINKDVTVYTKASIYKVTGAGVLTSIDGNVTLRLDAHDGGTSTGDMIGFTVLSSKTSSLYYSNNWKLDSNTLSWRTVLQPFTSGDGTAVVIG
ncbi:MAG: Ig-like domain-containing protein, partial [Actinomycetota bacterium]|nr:Ig-like domain-containing protein [Actinomycetota bacterium]